MSGKQGRMIKGRKKEGKMKMERKAGKSYQREAKMKVKATSRERKLVKKAGRNDQKEEEETGGEKDTKLAKD